MPPALVIPSVPPPPVIPSVVEESLRLAACAFGRIHEMSPRASLGRHDKGREVLGRDDKEGEGMLGRDDNDGLLTFLFVYIN